MRRTSSGSMDEPSTKNGRKQETDGQRRRFLFRPSIDHSLSLFSADRMFFRLELRSSSIKENLFNWFSFGIDESKSTARRRWEEREVSLWRDDEWISLNQSFRQLVQSLIQGGKALFIRSILNGHPSAKFALLFSFFLMKNIRIEEWWSEISSSSKSLDDRSSSIDNERLRRIEKRSTPRRSSTPLFSITLSNQWPIDGNWKNWTNVRRVDWLERIHRMSRDKVSLRPLDLLHWIPLEKTDCSEKWRSLWQWSIRFSSNKNQRTIVLLSKSMRRKAFDNVTDDDQLLIFLNIGKETGVSLSLSRWLFWLCRCFVEISIRKNLVTKKTARRVKWNEMKREEQRFSSMSFVRIAAVQSDENWKDFPFLSSPLNVFCCLTDFHRLEIDLFSSMCASHTSLFFSSIENRFSDRFTFLDNPSKRETERKIDLGRSTIDGMDRRWAICRRTDFHSSLARASPLVDEWGWNVFLHFVDGQLFDLVKNGQKRLSDVDSNLELNSRRETGEKKFFETLLIVYVDKRFHRWWMKLNRRNGWIDWKGQRMFLFPVLFTDVDETVRMRFFFRIDRMEEIRGRNESFLDLPLLDEEKSVLSMRCQLNGKISQSNTRLSSSWSSRRVVPFDVHRREVRSIENSSLEFRRSQWNDGRGGKRTSSISIASTEFRCCRVKRDSNWHDLQHPKEWQSNRSRSSVPTPPLE